MNRRGSAVIEAGAATAVVAVVTAVTLIATYAAFGRAYLEYRTEQALYCLAEHRRADTCRTSFRRSIASTLPFGRLTEVAVTGDRTTWKVHAVWTLHEYAFRIDKRLSLRRIVGRAASH